MLFLYSTGLVGKHNAVYTLFAVQCKKAINDYTACDTRTF